MNEYIDESGPVSGDSTLINGSNDSECNISLEQVFDSVFDSLKAVTIPDNCDGCGSSGGSGDSDDPLDYTEEEQFTGKYWKVDGKNNKIYRKTIKLNNPTAINTATYTPHGISGFVSPMKIEGFLHCHQFPDNPDYEIPVNYAYWNGSTAVTSSTWTTQDSIGFSTRYPEHLNGKSDIYVTLDYICNNR